jgi:putative cell wall-binding protein
VNARFQRRSLPLLLIVTLLMTLAPAAALASTPGAAPELLSPANGAQVGANPVLRWRGVPNAVRYRVQVSATSNFSSTLWTVDTYGLSATPPNDLPVGTIYWRVAGTDGGSGVGPYAAAEFERVWATFPAVHAPADGATLRYPHDAPLFQWAPLAGARQYRVEIATEPSFISPTVLTTSSTSAAPTTTQPVGQDGQAGGQTYYWRVQGMSGTNGVNSAWSTVRSYRLEWDGQPELVRPRGIGDELPRVTDVVLEWTPVVGASLYQVQVSPNQDWTNNVAIDVTVRGTRYAPHIVNANTNLLLNNGGYYWRVRAIDAPTAPQNFGRWSQVGQFIREWPLRPATPLEPADGTEVDVPTATWLPIENAAVYEIQFASGDDRTWSTSCFTTQTSYTPYRREFPTSNHGEPVLTSATHPCTSGIRTGQYVEWRVRGLDAPYRDAGSPNGVVSLWSTPRTFYLRPSTATAGPVQPVTPQSPPNCNATACALSGTPTLRWDPVPGATSYEVLVALDPYFTNQFRRYTTTYPQLTPRESYLDNQAGQPYYWFVRPIGAHNGPDPDADSSNPLLHPRFFTKRTPAPLYRGFDDEVNPSSPPATPQVVQDQLVMRWHSFRTSGGITDGRHYRVQVSAVPDFATVVDDRVVDQTTYTPFDRTYPEGPLHWRVQAIDGSGNPLTWSPPVEVEKRAAPLTLVHPQPDATVAGVPYLSWQPQAFANRYEVEIARNADTNFSTVNRVLLQPTKQVAFTPTSPLPTGTYAWRVRRLDADNRPGPWSAPRTFTLEVGAPALIAPAQGAALRESDVLFSWTAVPGAVAYRIESSTTPGFAQLLDNQRTVMTHWASPRQFGEGAHHWRVRALDAADNVIATSAVGSFTHTTAPTVEGHGPTGQAVPVGASFTVDFSEAVRGLSTSTFRMRQVDNGRAVAAVVTPSATTITTSATLTPNAPLLPGAEYVVEVTSQVRDLAGNALVPMSWTVRTATTTTGPGPGPDPDPTEAPGTRTTRRLGDSPDIITAAVSLSRGTFLDGAARHVVIGRNDVFADSLAGAPLAGREGPILYTAGGPNGRLAPATRAELQRVLGPRSGCGAGHNVYILGGVNAVSSAVEQEIAGLGYCVKRYAGASRVETSVQIATDVIRRTNARQVLVARSDNWADAATGGAYAAAAGVPIVVTQPSTLHGAARTFLSTHRPTDIVLLGGRSALSDEVLAQVNPFGRGRRVFGSARDQTAVEIGRQLWGPRQPTGVVLVNGYTELGWAYALAAAVPAAREGSVQLYVQPGVVTGATQTYLDGYAYRFVMAAGPRTLISDELFQRIAGAASS